MSLTAGTAQSSKGGGKHRKSDDPEPCSHTWGICHKRSMDADAPNEPLLPHLCGEGHKGHKGVHVCTVCDKTH